MTILYIHLVATFLSIFLGYYVFLLSQKPVETQKTLVYIISTTLITSGITGILLNPFNFGPFHVLSIVTITTIPLALWHLSQTRFLQFKKGLLYNFIGLNIAMIGAFQPDRYVGRRLHLTETTWGILMIFSVLIGIYMVIQANRNTKFFR
jgi:uncharacterized membrane protein